LIEKFALLENKEVAAQFELILSFSFLNSGLKKLKLNVLCWILNHYV